MTHNHRSVLAGSALILALAACSLPAAEQPLTVDEQAAAIIAATLTARAGIGSDVPASPTSSATMTITPTRTAGTAAANTAALTITPTYSTPMLTVLQQTNCREGPGQDYQVVFTYLANVKLEIAGRYDPTNFWLVKSPQSNTGSCWLWGEYVELAGSYWVVPTLTPPPTATLAPPEQPAIKKWNYSCDGGNLTFILEWEDRASSETGYRIFRDGEAVAELPANSTSWTETIPAEGGKEVQYYLQVYGPGGTANTSIIKLSC